MSLNPRFLASLALALAPAAGAADSAPPRGDAAATEFFEKKVRPVLVDNCYNCHSANTNAKGGLRVDDRNGLVQGGDRGPAVVPGHPEKSLLLDAVRYTDEDLKMPPKKHLSDEQIADLAVWIKDGAAWPQAATVSLGKANPKYDRLRKEHWAWQPLHESQPPAVRDAAWPRGDVDRFLLAKMEEKGLKPVGDADKLSLLRRTTFDLTGLPPTPEEIDAFLKDNSDRAFEKTVDRLLASPAFGERWGRHWLDVARYGESTGSSRNVPYPQAWRYRDYVIDAFNRDKPYDQFLREQIAGDLLPDGPGREERLTATGFLALGVKDVNQRFKIRFVMDNIDEQIDTVSRSVLGLTASCARCHDHKFDPIPQADYYALAGVFQSTDLCAGVRNKMGGGGLDYYDTAMVLQLGPQGPPDSATAEKIAKAKKAYEEARAQFQSIVGTPEGKALAPEGRPKQFYARQKMNKLQGELFALTDPALNGPVALGVRDAQTVGDAAIRIRGVAENVGPTVPRGFLSVVDVPGAPKIGPKESGRLELAEWLANEKNPLTSRVLVNRVWQNLFGQGLVISVDNFGVTGDSPSHPELLDALAIRFIHDGWSVKKLVRELVLSRAYRLGSDAPAAAVALDPADRLVWRHAPRRLSAEEVRDAMLGASGDHAGSRPDGPPAKGLKVIEMRNNGPEARRLEEQARANRRRSIYLPLLRGLTPRTLEAFDPVEQGMVTGNRDVTTVATQALYLLNDPFVRRESLDLAQRLLRQSDLDDAGRVASIYRLALGRPATTQEVKRAEAYTAAYAAAVGKTVAPVIALNSPEKEEPNPAPKEKPINNAANADEADQTDAPVKEEAVQPPDARTAAWASFCQALFGSAEYRYVR